MTMTRLSAYFTEPTGQKYLFYVLCLVYVSATTLAVIIEPFLTLPCDEVAGETSEIKFENALYKLDPCDVVRHPILLFFNKTECLRGRHLLMAVFLGSLIGYERRSSDRPAGIRTMALVSLGSALFTVNSTFGFLDGPMAWDASRVSAAIPSGVGFLGAGLIVKSSDTDPVTGERHHLVQGITTAAATWLSAAVGIACGGGLYFVAAFSTALNLMLLRFGPRPPPMEGSPTSPSGVDWSALDEVEKGTEKQPLYGATKDEEIPKQATSSVRSSMRNRPSIM